MAHFDRWIELSLTIDGEVKTYTTFRGVNLQIDFSLEKAKDGAPSQGEITVTGLTKDDIAWISTAFNPTTKQLNGCSVELKVGRGTGGGLLTTGDVIASTPNMDTANYHIKLVIMERAFNNLQKKNVSVSIKDAKLKDVCESIASNNNLGLEFQASDKKIGTYAFSGSPLNQIIEARKLDKEVDIFISEGTLVVIDKKKGYESTIEISAEEGMIGNPTPTALGCQVTTFLNPLFRVAGKVKLKSLKYPQLDGDYRVDRVRHEGGNRSPKWQTRLELRGI